MLMMFERSSDDDHYHTDDEGEQDGDVGELPHW